MTRISVSGVMSGHSGSPQTRPGVVVHDVDAAVLGLGRLEHRLERSRLGHVGADERRGPAEVSDEPDGLVATGLVDVGDDDRGALRVRRRAPSPARSRTRRR